MLSKKELSMVIHNIQESKVNVVLEIFKEKITNIYQDDLLRLILFGSRARGDAKQDSDIDVLIVLKSLNQDKDKYKNMINLVSDLCLEYGLLISCVYVSESQFKSEKSPLMINVHKEGILL